MASFRRKVIRGLFGTAERVSPGLAGRAAFRLFCRTPDPGSLTEGERRAVERASALMAEARHHRLKVGPGCVAVHEFRPEAGRGSQGTVLMIHGWRSRTEYMRALIEGFLAAGYRVVSLDLPGHGQSSGRRLTMVSAVEAVTAAGQWFGPFEAVVGHSFGGAVALTAMSGLVRGSMPLDARRLVAIASPSSLTEVFSGFGREINVGRRSLAVMSGIVHRLSGVPLADFDSHLQLAALPRPTLVIHAHDDREVGPHHAERCLSAGPHVQLRWADGLGHRRILSDPSVVAAAVRFVAGAPAPAFH